MDFILNGQAQGSVASVLMQNNFDVRALRPYIGEDGRSYITTLNKSTGKLEPVLCNTQATLRFLDWKLLDSAIVKAAKPRLRFVGDLRAAGLTFNIPNGMSKTVLETETQSDISGASVSMDGLREGNRDRPTFELKNLPLPIIHKDFSYSARQVMASRNGGSPLDTTTAELAARRVAETAEQLALGTYGSYSYGGGLIYGITNFPDRITYALSSYLASSWVPSKFLKDVLAMKSASQAKFHFGPWILYVSQDWDQILDNDYLLTGGVVAVQTLRERVKKIEGIQDVRTLDYLPAHTVVLVQQTTDVVREVMGMDITTLQWESQGGMQLNFKVMAIMVPQVRSDNNGNTGIVHGSF